MSAASKAVRAERRAQEREEEPVKEARIRAIAIIADGGGYRVARFSLPTSVAQEHCDSMSEPEMLDIRLAEGSDALRDMVTTLDGLDAQPRETCPTCGHAALIRHPTKTVWMCAACDARHEVSA
jgi:hypothetical protein